MKNLLHGSLDTTVIFYLGSAISHFQFIFSYIPPLLHHHSDQVRRRSSDLDELRRGHRAVEDKLEAKVKELKMELEDR